jgi:hypothetical protein
VDDRDKRHLASTNGNPCPASGVSRLGTGEPKPFGKENAHDREGCAFTQVNLFGLGW